MVCSIKGTSCHMGMKALFISLFLKNNLISMFDSLNKTSNDAPNSEIYIIIATANSIKYKAAQRITHLLTNEVQNIKYILNVRAQACFIRFSM